VTSCDTNWYKRSYQTVTPAGTNAPTSTIFISSPCHLHSRIILLLPSSSSPLSHLSFSPFACCSQLPCAWWPRPTPARERGLGRPRCAQLASGRGRQRELAAEASAHIAAVGGDHDGGLCSGSWPRQRDLQADDGTFSSWLVASLR
jgi:hypothetical protein